MKLHPVVRILAVAVIVSLGTARAQDGTIVATGSFRGAAHNTSGRATVYNTPAGRVLRLTHFKTSNGPNLHVLLIAATDAQDNENFLEKGVGRVDLGPLKGNEGDQNYSMPVGLDLSKFRTVSIFCERFDANFGAAPLQ